MTGGSRRHVDDTDPAQAQLPRDPRHLPSAPHPLSPAIGRRGLRRGHRATRWRPRWWPPSGTRWNTHHVIFFRDQSLTAEPQAAFARQFGTMTEAHPVLPLHRRGPSEVLAIDGKVDRAGWWHTDVTFLDTPAMGSILYMLEAPDVGGDTMLTSACRTPTTGSPHPVRAMCDQVDHHPPRPLVRGRRRPTAAATRMRHSVV